MLILRKNSSRQIKAGAVMSYISIGFSIIAGLIYTPWMIGQIGQADYGLYILGTSIITLFALDFGLSGAVSRFLSKYIANNDTIGANRFLGMIYKIFFVITFIIFIVLIVLYFLIEIIYQELSINELGKLKVIFLITGIFVTITFPAKPLVGILIANEEFFYLKLVDLIHKILIVLSMVCALLLGYGLYALILVNAFSGLIKNLLELFYVKFKTETVIDYDRIERNLVVDVIRFTSWSTVISISQRLTLNITPTILGALAGSSQIAIFAVGMTVEGYIWTISTALGLLFLPKVTRLTTNNSDNNTEVERLFIKVGRIQLYIIGLAIVGFISMGYEFIYLWIGHNFSESYYIALLLIIPGIIILTQEIAYTTLVSKNKLKYKAYATILAAIISLSLSLILSQDYGAIGSAFSILIGNFIGNILYMNYIYKKVLNFNISFFFKECHLVILPYIFLSMLIGFIIQILFPVNSLLFFMLKAILFMMIYAFLMWIGPLNKYEKDLIKSFIKK